MHLCNRFKRDNLSGGYITVLYNQLWKQNTVKLEPDEMLQYQIIRIGVEYRTTSSTPTGPTYLLDPANIVVWRELFVT